MSQALIVADSTERHKNQAVLKAKKKTTPSTPEQLIVAANVTTALEELGAPTPGDIAEACSVTEQAVSNWKRTGKVDKHNLAVLARLMRRDVAWFLVNRSRGEPPPQELHQAQTLSHVESMLSMTTLTWTQMMTTGEILPDIFKLQIQTDEMAPRVSIGAWVQFSAALASQVRPGDGVLLRDSSGGIHFRIYKAARPGIWEAHAENRNYEPLISDRDGLSVLAVLIAVEERWS